MQRSSESIAALAAALAKAQIELTNPEKALIGSIETKDRNTPERLFRYASLASGLEIVRKTLGRHEIATVQTTAIDQASGIVNLTTVLAHASGEWIASDWPVCAVSETTAPHRMGAALTYARRYALFTLVGIAGEDDLDAPDLLSPKPQEPVPEQAPSGSGSNGSTLHSRANGGAQTRSQPAPNKFKGRRPSPVPLGTEESARLRDQLIVEVEALADADAAALWAHRRLRHKDSLSVRDAEQIEAGFKARLAQFAEPKAINAASEDSDGSTTTPAQPSPSHKRKRVKPATIDKSLLSFSEPRRVRDREHVRHVAQQSCLVCGRKPCDAHHIRSAQASALGRKVSDEFTVPLCRGHHRELHRHGDEAKWWCKFAIDPLAGARALWLETHPKLAASSDRHTKAGQESRGQAQTALTHSALDEIRNEADLRGNDR
jgi:hypothetical protein